MVRTASSSNFHHHVIIIEIHLPVELLHEYMAEGNYFTDAFD